MKKYKVTLKDADPIEVTAEDVTNDGKAYYFYRDDEIVATFPFSSVVAVVVVD
jgi:hypothetical protein